MFTPIKMVINGVSPLLMHNSQLSNPINAIVRQIKPISSKRKKTDADYAELARLEWLGGLYVDNGRVVIPGENMEATFIAAAKKVRKGPQTKSGLYCDGNFQLTYTGAKDITKLYEDDSFVDTRRVCIQRASIMRTRPRFDAWSLDFTVHYEDEQLNESEVVEFAEIAGRLIGLCDYRPKFGRFYLESYS